MYVDSIFYRLSSLIKTNPLLLSWTIGEGGGLVLVRLLSLKWACCLLILN